MAHTELQNLIAARDKVDSDIRAYRVVEIRRYVAWLKAKPGQPTVGMANAIKLAVSMEETLKTVSYAKSDFDDLLTMIELQLQRAGIELETYTEE